MLQPRVRSDGRGRRKSGSVVEFWGSGEGLILIITRLLLVTSWTDNLGGSSPVSPQVSMPM